MSSIKKLLAYNVFKYVLSIFLTMILLLNVSFYIYVSVQYRTEINRQRDSLYTMTAHLATEENYSFLEVYLEHYTHTNNVIITFQDINHQILFTNNDDQITDYQPVYYENTLVGYLSANFTSSSLGTEYAYGFLALNLISVMLFSVTSYLLLNYLKTQNKHIEIDLEHIQSHEKVEYFEEFDALNQTLIYNQSQNEKQQKIYESHIKSLAHDIKTPLSVISIYAESLLSKRIPYHEDVIKDINEEVSNIEEIIPKFIVSSYDQLPYQQDISIFLLEYIDKYKDVFLSKNIVVQADLSPFIVTISDLDIKRLIEHTLFNAFYYSSINKTVQVSTMVEKKQLMIKDQGIGMSKETIEKIMNGPYRDETARKYNKNGNGLGYQIIKDICQRNNIELNINSVLNVGSIITFVFRE